MRTLLRRDADEGFSLVEVIVSLVVLSILAGAAATALIQTLGLTANGRLRASAAGLAERDKEVALGQGYNELLPGTTTNAVSVNGEKFTVQRTVSLAPGTSSSDSCSAPDGSRLAYKKVSVKVTWPNMRGTKPVQNDTVIAVPVGQVNSTLGAVSVPVVDRNTTGVPGITVTLSPSSKTAVTDAFGCAVFTDLNAGSYTATVNQVGYVGINNSQSATSTVATVSAGYLSKTSEIMYDRASTLAVSWAPPSASYVLPQDGQGVLVTNSMMSSANFRPFCSTITTSGCVVTSSGIGTITPVFPWSGSGLGLSAGKCLPGAGSKIQVAPAPGASNSVALPVGGTTVSINAAAATTVNVTLVRAADGVCTGGETLVVANNLAVPAGVSQWQVAVPYGTWTVEASSASAAGTAVFTVSDSSKTAIPSAVAL